MLNFAYGNLPNCQVRDWERSNVFRREPNHWIEDRKEVSQFGRDKLYWYTHGFGKGSHIVVEWLGRTNVTAGWARLTWSAGCKFTFLED